MKKWLVILLSLILCNQAVAWWPFGDKKEAAQPAKVIVAQETIAVIPKGSEKRIAVVTAMIQNIGKGPAKNISVLAACWNEDCAMERTSVQWYRTPLSERSVEIKYLAAGDKTQVTIPVAIQESLSEWPAPRSNASITCFDTQDKNGQWKTDYCQDEKQYYDEKEKVYKAKERSPARQQYR